MPPGEFDKKKIGERIKKLRTDAGLRQWQLAEMIGATQPAIHMYERGVLPEPKRLLELARIGNTTIEWILTGKHCEDGSRDMTRIPAHVHKLAHRFSTIDEKDQEKLSSAVRVLNSALVALEKSSTESIERMTVQEIARHLKDSSSGTLRVLCSALQIHDAVAKEVIDERIESFEGNGNGGSDENDKPVTRPAVKMRSNSIEAVRGNIFRLDGSLLAINEILKDRELRAELEKNLDEMVTRLKSKRTKSEKQKEV